MTQEAKTTMPSHSKTPQTQFLNDLSVADLRAKASLDVASSILIYDRKLERLSPAFRKLARAFPRRYAVTSGEALKSLKRFPAHAENLSRLALDLPARKMTIVAAGGGSVGDFAGFFASIFKRGVRLVHLPTTWLAAIDSSHGGKTALNVSGAKNQLGTFYPASKTILVRSILRAQPAERIEDAMGELAKIAIIDGGSWVRALEKSRLAGEDLLWKFLKPAIAAKMKIVGRDPMEKSGVRQILNLGHTMGHVIEAVTGMSHGMAVAQGLFFALEFSRSEGLLDDTRFERAMSLLAHAGLAPRPFRPISRARISELLMKDKKRSRAGEVTFVFVRGFGRCERLSVPIRKLVQEAKRQGWAT